MNNLVGYHNTDTEALHNILKEGIIKMPSIEVNKLDCTGYEYSLMPICLSKDNNMVTTLDEYGYIPGDIKITVENLNHLFPKEAIVEVSYNAYDYIDGLGHISGKNLKILRTIFRDTIYEEFYAIYDGILNKQFNIEYIARRLDEYLKLFSDENEISVYSDISTTLISHIAINLKNLDTYELDLLSKVVDLLDTNKIKYTIITEELF